MSIRSLLYENHTDLDGQDPVSGTGEGLADGTETPPTPQGDTTEPENQPPATVPYSRFKEVNEKRKVAEDSLAPFQELTTLGYGPDDLHRLVQWELEYVQDPVKTWLATASELEGLPESVRQAIAEASGQPAADPPKGDPPPAASEDESGDDEVPGWAKPLLERHQRQEELDREAELERVKADGQELLDGMISTWKSLDKKAGLREIPEKTMVAHILAASRTSDDPAEVVATARKDFLEGFSELLEADPGDGSTAPTRVPGSGSPPATPAPRPKTLREATAMAVAGLGGGELPAS